MTNHDLPMQTLKKKPAGDSIFASKIVVARLCIRVVSEHDLLPLFRTSERGCWDPILVHHEHLVESIKTGGGFWHPRHPCVSDKVPAHSSAACVNSSLKIIVHIASNKIRTFQ